MRRGKHYVKNIKKTKKAIRNEIYKHTENLIIEKPVNKLIE